MIVRELFAKLGLDFDAAAFAEATTAVEALKLGLHTIKDGLEKAVEGFQEMLSSTAEVAEQIEHTTQRTGIAADVIQGLGYAAKVSGASAEELTHALDYMARTGVRDLKGGLLSLADEVAAMPEGGARLQLVMRRLGRGAGDLVPLLAKGRDGIAELAAEAEDLGYVMGPEAIKAGVEYAETGKRVSAVWAGLTRTIAGELLPGASELGKLFVEWVRSHRDWIRLKVHNAVLLFKSAVAGARSVLGFLREHLGAVKVALFAVGAIMTGLALRSIVAYVAGLFAATAASEGFGLAAIMAGLRAGGAAVAAIAPWALLAGLLILIGDDIRAFLNGGDSLLGRYGEKFTHFLDAWTRGNPDDWWILKAVKATIAALADLQGTYEKFKASFAGAERKFEDRSFFGKVFTKPGDQTGDVNEGFAPLRRFLGLESAPGPSLPDSPALRNTMNANVTINAGAGADPKAISDTLIERLTDWHDTIMRQTHAATR